MATWGEFIAEIPIINKRSEGIFVKADHVLDLWEERNRLRAELAALKGSSGEAAPAAVDVPAAPAPAVEEPSDATAREREQCAQEVEEFAQTCPVDPAWREWAVQLLQTAAQMLRERSKLVEDADFLAQVVIPPSAPVEATSSEAPLLMAEPVDEDAAPMAEPVSDEMPPMAEPVADDHSSIPQ